MNLNLIDTSRYSKNSHNLWTLTLRTPKSMKLAIYCLNMTLFKSSLLKSKVIYIPGLSGSSNFKRAHAEKPKRFLLTNFFSKNHIAPYECVRVHTCAPGMLTKEDLSLPRKIFSISYNKKKIRNYHFWPLPTEGKSLWTPLTSTVVQLHSRTTQPWYIHTNLFFIRASWSYWKKAWINILHLTKSSSICKESN